MAAATYSYKGSVLMAYLFARAFLAVIQAWLMAEHPDAMPLLQCE